MGYTRYRKPCGNLRPLFCTERQKYEAIMAEKRRRAAEVEEMHRRMQEISAEIGI